MRDRRAKSQQVDSKKRKSAKSARPRSTGAKKALGKLIQEALDRKRLRPAAAARLIDLTASQMSRALAGTRSIPAEKLVSLADFLGLSREEAFRAAGKSEVVDIDLPNVIPSRVTPTRLTVVTDPRFVDSALFWWIFGKQPFMSMGVECVLKPESWEQVPRRIDSYPFAIGFFNKEIPKAQASELRLRHWTDLCLYKGYAVIARKQDLPANAERAVIGPNDVEPLTRSLRERAIAAGRKPTILTMGDDPTNRLTMSMKREFEGFVFEKQLTADQALDHFIQGSGECFLGGLPQRLRLADGPYVEIVHFDNNPFLFSVNSLFATQAVFEQRRDLLHTASGLWFETVRRVRRSANYRNSVAAEIVAGLDLSGEGHSVQAKFFEDVFGPGGEQYEVFSDRPGDLVGPLLETAERIARTGKSEDFAKLFGYLRTVAAPNSAAEIAMLSPT